MEKAIFTTLCMLSDSQGNILMQERCGTRWDGLAFPGGHVECGESFTDSAIREVKEETGFTIENPQLCGIKQFPTEDGCRYVIILYKANRFHGELQSSAEGQVYWVKREEIKDYHLANDMAAMLELFEDDEKSEFYYYEDNGVWKYKII